MPDRPERLVVVGGSLAGLRAVEAARRADADVAITLIGAEPHVPYDRPPLSKELLAVDAERTDSALRADAELRDDFDVALRLGTPASALDPSGRTVTVGDVQVPYDAVVLATGSTPRTLPGARDLAGVHTLRTIEDSRAIRSALDAGARTVLIGGGFIGGEIATAARARGLDVTVVESLAAPLVRAVGATVGAELGTMHSEHGTRLLTGAKVESLEGSDRVERVQLADGTELPADLVVVGIGATPNIGWLESSGLKLDDGVVCDATLQAAPGVWAAGDIVRWPNPTLARTLRIEHWTNAAEQGTRAGRNAVAPDAAEPYAAVPYVWSDWYGSRIQIVGLANDGEVDVVWGGFDQDRVLALYRDGDRLTGAVGRNAARGINRMRKLVADRGSYADAVQAARELPPPTPKEK